MKIGILTYNRALNYGAILQMIALYMFIRKEKDINNLYIIDYRSPYIEKHYKKFTFFDLFNFHKFKSIFFWNSYSFLKRDVFKNYLGYFDFLFTKPLYSKDFHKNIMSFDKIIVGSDQVWNPHANNFDVNYFLPFNSNTTKKYSYSASIGSNDVDNQTKGLFIKYLPYFRFISLREISSVINLKSFLSNTIENHIDPTLLYNEDFWIKYSLKLNLYNEAIINNKFVLIYLIVEDLLIINEAVQYAKSNSLTVVYITDRFKKPKNTINISSINPGQWLYLFSKAKVIFTNSYHGLIFSFTFNKKCNLKLLPEPAKVNLRITELIKYLKLDYTMNKSSYVFDFNFKSQDTLSVLEYSRNASSIFIDKILND